MKTFLEHFNQVQTERFEELTQASLDLHSGLTDKNKILVTFKDKNTTVFNQEFAPDLKVRQILNAIIQKGNLKLAEIDPNALVKWKEALIGDIADDGIVEFQINQKGVLVANPKIIDKSKQKPVAAPQDLVK